VAALAALAAGFAAARSPETPPAERRGATMPQPCKPPVDARTLRTLARQALDALETLTPVLPGSWPRPEGAAYYAYHAEPLPTGVVAYAVRGPLARIAFPALEGTPRVERLRARALGREDRPPSRVEPADLEAAEQVILHLVAGCVTPAEAAPKLGPYRAWLAEHPRIAASLERREPAFVRWLRRGG